MNKRIEVPAWFLILSASLNLLTIAGLVVMLLFPGVASKVVTVVEIRVTATPEPVTATTVPSTATPQPTATALPPTATRVPVATSAPCTNGGVPGVDCPLDVDGLAVTVVSLERSSVFTVTTETGEEKPYVPTDAVNDEFLTVHLILPLGTVKDDLNVWFEDGGVHAPQLVDETGKVYDYASAWVEETEDGFGVAILFVVPKDVGKLTLQLQYGEQVDLSLVTDITVAVETPTPSASPTSIFNP